MLGGVSVAFAVAVKILSGTDLQLVVFYDILFIAAVGVYVQDC